MLIQLLRECPDEIAADLRRFYQVRLSDFWVGLEDSDEVAGYVLHMPRGGAFGEWLGGQSALTGQEDMLRLIEHAIWASQSQHPSKVKLRPYPEGVREQQRKAALFRANARRYKQRRRAR